MSRQLVMVTVGTDIHPFPRLMSWVEQWYCSRPAPPELIVQHGHCPPPRLPGAQLRPFLDHDALRGALERATAVISHGGPATITEARRAGHVPLVVARDPAHGEHVDDHQQRFAARLARSGMVKWCRTAPELAGALDGCLADPAAHRHQPGTDGAQDRLRAVTAVGRIVEDLVRARQAGRRTSRRRR